MGQNDCLYCSQVFVVVCVFFVFHFTTEFSGGSWQRQKCGQDSDHRFDPDGASEDGEGGKKGLKII